MNSQRKTLSELAQLVGGRVVGDENVEIQRVVSIEHAEHGDITFVAHPRYRSYLAGCGASAIIVGPEVPLASLEEAGKGFLQVSQPYLAFARILQLFTPGPVYDGQVSAQASIDPTAVLAERVTVFPNVYVGKGASVGRGSVLFPGVYLGEEVEVGEECVLHAQVTVRERCRIGNRVILHPGVVIGSDGFGYAGEGEERVKIPQVGAVDVEDDVEIGANTTIDRGTLGKTVVGRGTKIDNLVQIAHNVVVGEHTIIAAQAGIAGSTRIGNDVVLAGQVGVVNHIEIGDKVTIGPQSGVPHSVPSGSLLSGGLAAAPHLEWLKVVTMLPRLPKLWATLRHLERKVSRLEDVKKKGVKTHA
ncbi:MAG: UDP-3-O-(3-hydroxymyristoyl)glucosamine N-acyltransferase [Candidatus Binatia bacterium]